MLIGLDLDGVLCDLGPGLSARIAARFGIRTHPASWRTYDLRRLRLHELIERMNGTHGYRVTATACASPYSSHAPTLASLEPRSARSRLGLPPLRPSSRRTSRDWTPPSPKLSKRRASLPENLTRLQHDPCLKHG